MFQVEKYHHTFPKSGKITELKYCSSSDHSGIETGKNPKPGPLRNSSGPMWLWKSDEIFQSFQ